MMARGYSLPIIVLAELLGVCVGCNRVARPFFVPGY